MRERNLKLERELTDLACEAGGLPGAGGRNIRAFADGRALPGGVRLTLDADREAAEELADARNYLVWGIVAIYPAVLAGEPNACANYERRMRALTALIKAWVALHTEGS
jgi:hypothetical protein